LKVEVIYNFILTFLVLNFLIAENPFKNIHLTSFRVFLPKFMIIGRGSFSEVQPKIELIFYNWKLNVPAYSKLDRFLATDVLAL